MIRRIKWWMPLVVVAMAVFHPRAVQAQGYVVVVNAAGPVALSKDDVVRIFTKKRTDLTAVDQDKGSKARAAFSEAVLGKPASAMVSYWQQQIFSGKDVPPAEKGSDAEVLAFVRGNPRGIGYVAAGTPLGDGVKSVTIR